MFARILCSNFRRSCRYSPNLVRYQSVQRPKLIQNVVRDDVKKLLGVTWTDGRVSQFPYVWLRDNCPAPHTYHISKVGVGRHLLLSDLDLNVLPEKVENREYEVLLRWPGKDECAYAAQWLQNRDISNNYIQMRRQEYAIARRTHWGSKEIQKTLKWVDFEECLVDGSKLHDALVALWTTGIVMFQNVPSQPGQLERFAKHIGFSYLSHYGHVFTVKSDPAPTNLAYTSHTLGMHTDLPYYRYPAQVQCLHCIKQTGAGGENQFADGLHVAEQLRRERPDIFRLLTEVSIEYVDEGRDHIPFHASYRWPIFTLDAAGNVNHVCFNNMMRSWFWTESPENIQHMYKAMKVFYDQLYESRNVLEMKLKPGEMVAFDNLRVLHGRTGFQVTSDSSRHLEGTYFTWDILKSRIRLLRSELGLESNQVSAA